MLDLSNLSELTGFDKDLTVSLIKDHNGNDVTNDVIKDSVNCPRKPITYSQYLILFNSLKRCIDSKGIQNCKAEEHLLNQYIKIDDVITRKLISSCQNTTKDEIQNNSLATAATTASPSRKNSSPNIEEITLTNGQAALGTLLLPYLYIRWGETVLHNSFPAFLLDEPTPQIRNNVSSMEISIDTATAGGEDTGGSGSGASGVSTCELTLNPQLVDENGDAIVVQTDGAELLVIWGYPNSNQVRTHTFAQVGVKDSFFNEQKTILSFRGSSWKLSRLSEQKRYPSGNLKERVFEVGRQICKQQGYVESDCPNPPVIIEPPNSLDGLEIGETTQDGSLIDYMTRLVERARGCTFHHAIDRDAYNDADRTKLKLSINCVSSLNDEDPETNLVLVDRALWLGQGLAERVELSDVGDTASSTSNTGGNCGGTIEAKTRPKNLVLRSFEKGCDYRILNRSQLSNVRANTANEFILRLVLDDSTDVPLLSPFNGTVVEVGPEPACNSTNSSDTTCGGANLASGSGNFVKLQAKEPNNSDLDGIIWTFYYVAGINVSAGEKVTAGQVVATQGSSGVVENNVTGIRIERDGEKLPEDEGLVFIEDYIDTITFPCQDLTSSCLFNTFVTSGALQPGLGGTKDHIHYETLRGPTDAVSAFDNMAASDPETCYNLNQIINGTKNSAPSGERACWNTAWDNKTKNDVVRNCSKSHSHSPPKGPNNIKCDFWVFDKKTEFINSAGKGRTSTSARNRPIANPYPNKAYRFMNTNAGPPLGAAVLFFDDINKPATNTLGFDPTGNGFAMMLHGDSAILNAPLSPGGPAQQGCSGNEIGVLPIVDEGDSTDNEFLENASSSVASVDCGADGKYPNMSDEQAKVLNNFCKEEDCNPKDIAAFIQAECGWNLDNKLNKNCSGAFQCCTGQAPEAAMRKNLEAKGETFFKNCNSLRSGQPLINHLKAWKAYKEESTAASGVVPINAGLCANYTQIALPALVPAIRRNLNAKFKEECLKIQSDKFCRCVYDGSTCNSNSRGNLDTWFRGEAYETATLAGICKYARRVAINDARLEGGCNFNGDGTSFDPSTTSACTNNSSNRSLNARNTGTLSSGGLRDIKFRQEIRLNAEFGICPRNVFLSPTDTNGKPNYILLANMDNSEGFADFKIRSVNLSWNGSWRWSVTAFRPATDVTFETPPTLIQPRSLNEWINYYWLLDRDFLNEASQFSPPGDNPLILPDGTLDPSVPVAGSSLTNEASNNIKRLTQTIDNFYFEENKRQNRFNDEQAGTLEDLAQEIRLSCAGIATSCLKTIEEYKESSSFEVYTNVFIRDPGLNSSEITMPAWIDRTLIEELEDVADSTTKK